MVCKIFQDLTVIFEESVKSAPVLKKEEEKIKNFLNQRRAFCLRQIHLAANLLDPNLRGQNLINEEQVDAMEFISNVAENSPDLDGNQIMTELALYIAKDGFFSKSFLWKCCKTVPPLTWWKGFCASQQLSKVATKILGSPPTSAACERSFSAFANIQNKKKNRLENIRASKLVFIAQNIRLFENDNETSEMSLGRDTIATSEVIDANANLEVICIDNNENETETEINKNLAKNKNQLNLYNKEEDDYLTETETESEDEDIEMEFADSSTSGTNESESENDDSRQQK